MSSILPTCRRQCLAQAQIGLRRRQRASTLPDTRNTISLSWTMRTRGFRTSPLRSASLSDADERLLAVVRKKDELYQAALKEQSQENDVSSQIIISKTLKDLGPLSHLFREYITLSTSLSESLPLLSDPDKDIRSMAEEEITTLETTMEQLRRERLPKLLLPDSETARLSALVEIKPGVGGAESTLFLSTILRMYTRYASLKNWKIETLSGGNGDNGEAVFKVVGSGAFGEFKWERGVHRVQRVPATESAGRVHTSTIAVVVLPVLEDSDQGADDLVDPKDVKTEVMRSRGAGGQHVNKTESAVRLTHLPTGISVSMQDSRSQHQNKAWAWQVLRSRLASRKMEKEVEDRREARGRQVKGAGRSEKIRTYNFPQDRLTDHRIGLTITGLDNILEGEGLEYVIHKLKENDQNERMEALLADGEDPGEGM